jgi:capsular exopolysaccharide synthesis family protein
MDDQPLLGPGKPEAENHLPARARYAEIPRLQEPGEQGQSPCLLFEYWDIMRRRKGVLAVSALLGVAAALLVTLPQKPVYQARASLEIQNLNENFLNIRAGNPTESGQGFYPAEYELQTHVKISQSEAIIGKVIARLNLETSLLAEQDEGLLSSWGQALERRLSAWRRALGLPVPPLVSARDEVLPLVAERLDVRNQTNTRLIEILYDDTNPKRAAEVVNALTAEFIQENLEARWKTAQATGEWLTRQIEETKIKLEKSEAQLQHYASASGLLFTSEKDNVAEEKLRQLQKELSTAQADRVARQSRYELVATASADSLPEVLDNATLKDYQVKLTDLRRQLAELSSSLTADHPSVKKAQAQAQTLESALERERASTVGRIRNEFESAQRREKLLATDYASHARFMSEQAGKVTHYNILKREVDTIRELYNSMLQRVREAGVASALRVSNIRVVDMARPPASPYKPRIPLNSALGLSTGLLFGMIFVVMRERADRTIQTPGDASSYLKLQELGVIPSAKVKQKQIANYHGEALTAQGVGGKRNSPSSRVELVTWQGGSSVVAESSRAALTSILYSGKNGDRPRVIVLTSALPGEGKTTVATNLALALAEIGRRVLLIDGDLRNPRIHRIFDLSNEWGLSNLLAGKSPPDGREAMYIQTGRRDLCLLPAGSVPTSISDALHSSRASEFLDRIRREFDAVIIDSPPMLQLPDARILGHLSDGVVLVVRASETMRETALAATQRLIDDGTRVLGTILNQWDPRKMSHYAYGYPHSNRG